MDHVWRRMRPKLEEEKAAAEQQVLSGGCDPVDYARTCERVRLLGEIIQLGEDAEAEWTRIQTREQEPS